MLVKLVKIGPERKRKEKKIGTPSEIQAEMSAMTMTSRASSIIFLFPSLLHCKKERKKE
jgi:hypothetical protein